MNFNDLNWPRGLNLDLLVPIVPQATLLRFVLENADNTRKERRIVLPSQRCIKKAIAHYFGCQVEQGNTTWDKVMRSVRNNYTYFYELGLTMKEMKRLYEQRKREIIAEKRGHNK